MTIRTYIAGDEVAQVGIYNEAAAELPKFKPASIDEVRRRLRGLDFDPALRFYFLVNERPVAYITCQANGRVSYPWCRRGQEASAEPLLNHALQALRGRGMKRAFAAYRGDWAPTKEFFEKHGFQQTREMVNYVMDLAEMPTPAARPSTAISSLTAADLPALARLGKGVYRTDDPAALGKHYLENPYFPANSCFAVRSRTDGSPIAFGLVIANPTYADPKQLDSAMPCYRLGAIGSEELTTKRINGMFSFAAPDCRDLTVLGLELLGYATHKVENTDIATFAAQVPSDAAHLARFYKQYFRRQGAFPVFEKAL